MVRNVFRRLERLETRAMATTPGPIDFRILLVHPVQGLTGVLVFDSDGSRKEPGTPEEIDWGKPFGFAIGSRKKA